MAELAEGFREHRIGTLVRQEVDAGEGLGRVIGKVGKEDVRKKLVGRNEVEGTAGETLAVIGTEFELYPPHLGIAREVGEEPRLAFLEGVEHLVVHAEKAVAVLGILNFVRVIRLGKALVLGILPNLGVELFDLVEDAVNDRGKVGGNVEADVATPKRIRGDLEIEVKEFAQAVESERRVETGSGEEARIDGDLGMSPYRAGSTAVQEGESIHDAVAESVRKSESQRVGSRGLNTAVRELAVVPLPVELTISRGRIVAINSDGVEIELEAGVIVAEFEHVAPEIEDFGRTKQGLRN